MLLALAPLAAHPVFSGSFVRGNDPGIYAPDPTATVSRPDVELRVRSDKRVMEFAAAAHGTAHIEGFRLERPSAGPPDGRPLGVRFAAPTPVVFAARAPPSRTATG